MTYDQWKTDSGYDERDDEECPHDSFEIDMEGRAHCDTCPASWMATADEITHQRTRQVEYDAWCRQQARREFWRKLTYPVRRPLFRLLERVWPRKALSVLTDDEIPF